MDGGAGDLQLARRVIAGDEAAFRLLFDTYFPKLYRMALVRLGGRADDAHEVVQLTFCRVFERIESYRGEASLYAWMCQICRNAVYDLGREHLRDALEVPGSAGDATIDALIESLAAPTMLEPENAAWRLQLVGLIQTTLDALPDAYAEVLEMKYVDGLPVAEIARRRSLGLKAAESLLTRARAAFRASIGAWCRPADLFRTEEP